jgi:endonuclease-3
VAKGASVHQLKILKGLAALYPDVTCALTHDDPLQLLISTILSAQCTDERVNKVTPALFRKYKTARAYAKAPLAELEEMIRSTGFFRSKAKAIAAATAEIDRTYAGRVPNTMEELTRLRGVGRKTANVVLSNVFGINEGIVVDTHVGRLSRRLGFTKQKDPVKIEQDLMRIVPQKDWAIFSHRMIWHGRKLCKALKPRCGACPIAPLCPSSEV